MEDEQKPLYLVEYEKFMDEMRKGVLDANAIGKWVNEMTVYFCNMNRLYATRKAIVAGVHKEFINSVDGEKPMAIGKAEVLMKASDANRLMLIAQADAENLKEIINSMKALQKNAGFEYDNQA